MSAQIIPFESAAMRDLQNENLKLRMVAVALLDLTAHALKAASWHNATEFEDERGMPLSVHVSEVSMLPFIRDVSKRSVP